MKKLMGCPAWLELSDDRTSFIMVEERAETVRYIFKLSIAGFGAYSIAKKLTINQFPTFKAGGKWDQSVVFNILNNRATYGEYIPGKYKKKNRTQVSGDPVANFYPAVIDQKIFNAAQASRRNNWSSGRGRKGKHITNLFAGLATCRYCGSSIKFVSNGRAKSLVCEKVLGGLDCVRFAWSYGDFEEAFMNLLKTDERLRLELSIPLAELDVAARSKSDREVYNARTSLAEQLRVGPVSLLQLSVAGQEAGVSTTGRVVKNHPKRSFILTLTDGYSRIGRPAPVVRTVKFAPLKVSQQFGLTPRQGQLAALLAEGESLSAAASILGMTLETARWHLRKIFSLTNIHTQEDLVKSVFSRCL